jgi:hypothetical protein
MKKLFTIFACASFAFTLSAQDSEQAKGSFYLGTGDALELVNIFGGDIDMSATIGYAVIDGLVVSGSINSNSYMDAFGVDAVDAVDEELDMCGNVVVAGVAGVAGVDATYANAINFNLGVRYFWNGIFVQAAATNLLSAGNVVAEGEDDIKASISLGVGKYFSLGAVSDRFYVDPQINYNLDTGFNTMIGLGARF